MLQRHRAGRWFRCVSVLVACLLVAPSLSFASAEEIEPPGFSRYEWLINEADQLARSYEYNWFNAEVAARAATSTALACDETHLIRRDTPEASDPIARISELYDQAVRQRVGGDWSGASATLGEIAHHLSDLSVAPRAVCTTTLDPRLVDYEERAGIYFDAADRNDGWVGQQGLPLVRVPSAGPSRLAVGSSAKATRSLETTMGLRASNVNPEARKILAGSMEEAVRILAAMIASITFEGDPQPVDISRLAGADRFQTAVRISQASFPGQASTVVIVNSHAWPDGLSAGPLASAVNGPILLVKRDGMPPLVAEEISRLGARRAIIVGGTRAVSAATASSIDALPGVAVERIAGTDRAHTAALVARKIRSIVGRPIEQAFVVSASRFADCLSITSIASARREPILLAGGAGLPPVTESALSAVGVKRVTIVGGTLAVSSAAQSRLKVLLGTQAVERIAGNDRYATSALVRDHAIGQSWVSSESVGVATGVGFADAISAGPLLGRQASPTLLTRHTRLPAAAVASLRNTGSELSSMTIIGGEAAVSGLVERDAQNAVTGQTTPPNTPRWSPKVMHYGHTSDFHGSQLRCYYIDLKSAKESLSNFPRDKSGVVMVSYNDGPLVYNPVTVGLNALACYEAFIHDGDTQARAEFLLHANWLKNSMDSQGRLPYNFFYRPRAFEPPWYSAMAQGYAMSALLRAWQLTGDSSYKVAAGVAFKPMLVSVDRGGVGYSVGPNLWLEEYPDKHHVLNGWIFASWGVWDLYRSTGNTQALAVWESTTKTLRRTMGDYEVNGAVLYELKPGNWSRGYHSLQIHQMRILGLMTGMADITQRADKWTLMYNQPQVVTAQGHAQTESEDTIDPIMGISPLLLAP